jgi:uncharacterized damage-inducible protein DinB
VTDDPKATLHRYLVVGREALLWKLDGLSEYDVRRPLVPTGTNLLGLLKHVAAVEAGYLGLVFDRPFPGPTPWSEDDEVADLWATAAEDRDELVALARTVWQHADATIEALPLDAVGHVPWWGEQGTVTLHRVLVHVATELHRHAGHADLLRELIDGEVGLRPQATNLPDADAGWWQRHHARVEEAARDAGARDGSTPTG